MKIYLKNKISNKISTQEADSFFSLSKNIRDLNDEATQQEADSFKLQEAKDSKTAQVLVNRNNWMYQPVFYVVDSVEREFKATEIAGLNLIAVARSPRNIIAGTINWLDIVDAPILLTIDQAEGIIDIIEDQRSYSYFHQVTLDTEIKNCNTIAEVEAINIDF
jgi:hypothetical protein